MKNHLLNIILVLVIVIGGLYLIQPEPAYAQSSCPECETCVVREGDEPCPTCFSSECDQTSGTKCGTLENGETGEQTECWRSGGVGAG